jgi:hypothetical protein
MLPILTVAFMSEYPIKIETEHEVIELTKDQLRVHLKQEAIEGLKELTKNNEMLHTTVLTLLRWAHYPLIAISDIIAVSLEVIPIPPGRRELMKLIIKTRYHGGERTHEFYLNPMDAKKLAADVKSLITPQF